MRLTHSVHSEKSSFYKSSPVTRTSFDFRMSSEQRTTVTSISFSTLWTRTYTQSFERIFSRTFTSSTSSIKCLSAWSTCILQICYTEIWSQVIYSLTQNAMWRLQTLAWLVHLTRRLTSNPCWLIMLRRDGTALLKFSWVQTSIQKE